MMTYLRGSLLQTTGTKTLKNGLIEVYGGAVGMVLFPTSSISVLVKWFFIWFALNWLNNFQAQGQVPSVETVTKARCVANCYTMVSQYILHKTLKFNLSCVLKQATALKFLIRINVLGVHSLIKHLNRFISKGIECGKCPQSK